MHSKPQIPDEIEEHRDEHWRREGTRQIESAFQAERFIEQIGFAACLTDSRRPGPSLYVAVCGRRDAVMPRHVQKDPESSLTWQIKDELVRRGHVYYAKLARGKATFIAPRIVPYFHAIWGVRKAGEPRRLSRHAQAILKVLRREWEMSTSDLRDECGIRDRAAFTRALDELQAAMIVIPSAVYYLPKLTYVWTLGVGRFPEPLRRRISRTAALCEIARCFLAGAGMTVPGELARVTGLSRPEAGLGNRALVSEGYATNLGPGVYRLAASLSSMLAFCFFLAIAAHAQTPQETSGPGRVAVTISVEGLRIPAVQVELRSIPGNAVFARTTADAIGQVMFSDVAAGRYVVRAVREGFADAESAPFDVRGGTTEQVLIEMRLTFVRESVEVILPANSPTESLQPVAMSDLLTGAKMDVQPLAGDDFQSLLTVLPSIVRGPEGRLRVKGGAPTTGALQVSSASLNDPSTGDFDLELPSGALESVEVLSNPFAAEYGRFSTSVTQVSTKRGTNEWIFKPGNLMPNFGRGLIDRFEPRLAISGPLKRDRLLFGQYLQYRYARTPIKSLPGEPLLGLTSFDSYTRVDAVLSSRHALTGGVIYFPRRISNATLSTFRPPEATPKFTQEGFSAGVVDRVILTDRMVLESTVAGRLFEVDQKITGDRPMVYAPQTQSGTFFNSQERNVRSLQVVGALTIAQDRWRWGQHVFKLGVDMQRSSFDGQSVSTGLDVVRLDGSLAERTSYRQVTPTQEVGGTELATFAQDRWRVSNRVSLELGIRADREAITEKINVSPRLGMSVSVLPEGRAILRGGFGKFVERTPLTVGAFTQYDVATVNRFGATGAPLGPPVTYAHVIDGALQSPESLVKTAAWDQRFGRRVFFKAAYAHRTGSHAYTLYPDAARGALVLSSTGESKYWEIETTGRYLANERRDLTVSYVHSRSTRDLNDYDDHFGNFRNPIIRGNENSLSPTDVPHRLIVRGSLGLPGTWILSPLYERRTGFPWSAVDEFQDFVGARNQTGRLPRVSTLDFTLTRPWQFKKYHFTGGLRVYNAFGRSNQRDVQSNITAPDYGAFYNPIRRSIGFVLSAGRP